VSGPKYPFTVSAAEFLLRSMHWRSTTSDWYTVLRWRSGRLEHAWYVLGKVRLKGGSVISAGAASSLLGFSIDSLFSRRARRRTRRAALDP
jgi:hypothetical protein